LAIEYTNKLHWRKAQVGYGTFQQNPAFLASFTQEDREYIKQVGDAERLDAMPPDNGRNFQTEEIEFRKRQHGEGADLADLADEALKDGSW
jgi:hypothetical protein